MAVIGVGGVFVKSADPAATRAWYQDVLGMSLSMASSTSATGAAPTGSKTAPARSSPVLTRPAPISTPRPTPS